MDHHISQICGSEFWDNSTVYAEYPDFTFCFQHTVLVWFPCIIFWAISPLWMYMLTRQTTPKLPFSWVFTIKILFAACLAAIEAAQVFKAYMENRSFCVYYLSPVVVMMTNLFAIFISNFERVRGLRTSSFCLAYWSFTFFGACIRLRSMIINNFILVFYDFFKIWGIIYRNHKKGSENF